MNNPDTDLIFPLRALPLIEDAKDVEWKRLVEFIRSDAAALEDRLCLVLLLVRLAGCASCDSNSYRAMRGCSQCAIQTIRRQRVSGNDLRAQFEQNRVEINQYLAARNKYNSDTVTENRV
jgi:hypothetical protein